MGGDELRRQGGGGTGCTETWKWASGVGIWALGTVRAGPGEPWGSGWRSLLSRSQGRARNSAQGACNEGEPRTPVPEVTGH